MQNPFASWSYKTQQYFGLQYFILFICIPLLVVLVAIVVCQGFSHTEPGFYLLSAFYYLGIPLSLTGMVVFFFATPHIRINPQKLNILALWISAELAILFVGVFLFATPRMIFESAIKHQSDFTRWVFSTKLGEPTVFKMLPQEHEWDKKEWTSSSIPFAKYLQVSVSGDITRWGTFSVDLDYANWHDVTSIFLAGKSYRKLTVNWKTPDPNFVYPVSGVVIMQPIGPSATAYTVFCLVVVCFVTAIYLTNRKKQDTKEVAGEKTLEATVKEEAYKDRISHHQTERRKREIELERLENPPKHPDFDDFGSEEDKHRGPPPGMAP